MSAKFASGLQIHTSRLSGAESPIGKACCRRSSPRPRANTKHLIGKSQRSTASGLPLRTTEPEFLHLTFHAYSSHSLLPRENGTGLVSGWQRGRGAVWRFDSHPKQRASRQTGTCFWSLYPPNLERDVGHLLRTPTTTSPTPAMSEMVLNIGEIGTVLVCLCES